MQFKWSQPSLKFAVTDFRRNWPRWLFWAALFVGCVAAAVMLTDPDPNPRNPPPRLLVFFPVLFVGVMGTQFLSTLLCYDVEISNQRIELGHSRNSRSYQFRKLANVQFAGTKTSGSMLLNFKSGKQVEIFLNPAEVQIHRLKHYFTDGGVSVSGGEAMETGVPSGAEKPMLQRTATGTDSQNGLTISVRGYSSKEIDSIMTAFAQLYDLDLSTIGIGAARNGAQSISLPDDIEPKLFLFLVNYLCYPEIPIAEGRTIGVLGRAKISQGFQAPASSLIGQPARFYVPADDRDYDVVYAILTSNEAFKIPFTNLKWKRTEDARLPDAIHDL
jgi:hypothetical protein